MISAISPEFQSLSFKICTNYRKPEPRPGFQVCINFTKNNVKLTYFLIFYESVLEYLDLQLEIKKFI